MNHANRGVVLSALRRFGEAVAAYERALELDPGRAPYHYYLGNNRAELGRYSEALEAIDRTLELDPGNEKAVRIRQRLLRALHP